MVKQMRGAIKKEMRWTSRLITQLRGKRSLAEFGALLGAPKNTVWRWEAGQARPDALYSERLSDLAERERFLKDWKLVESMTLLGDLETANAEIGRISLQEDFGDWAEHLTAQPGFDLAPLTVEAVTQSS